MAFTAADVKNLRETTGVGMMDCKKALTEADGDFDKAIEILREKGLAASQKKAGRIAAEGMAYAASIDGVGVVVEVNAETDFVAKNEKFVDFVKGVAATIAANKPADLDALMECKYNGTDLTVTQQQQEMVLVIGENIKVRRFAIYTEGVSVPYIHAGGKIGVLVNLETDLTAEQVNEAGKDVAMQIAALNPRFWDKSQVTEDVLAEEKKIMLVQMENDPKMASKPEKVREGIVTGKLRKFYGVPAVVVRTYAYIRSLGQEGLKQVAELAILNNNYMLSKLLKIHGLSMPYAEGVPRIEHARLSWKELTEETGVTTDDICRRIVDYGFQDYFASHHPRIVPEPFTPEPVETYSKDDIDEYVAAFESIARECYENPELVKTAPHKAALATQIVDGDLNDIGRLATTLRAYRKFVENK